MYSVYLCMFAFKTGRFTTCAESYWYDFMDSFLMCCSKLFVTKQLLWKKYEDASKGWGLRVNEVSGQKVMSVNECKPQVLNTNLSLFATFKGPMKSLDKGLLGETYQRDCFLFLNNPQISHHSSQNQGLLHAIVHAIAIACYAMHFRHAHECMMSHKYFFF